MDNDGDIQLVPRLYSISSSCPVWYWRERRLETGTTDMRAGSVHTASRARVASGARGMPVNAGRMLASDAPLKL